MPDSALHFVEKNHKVINMNASRAARWKLVKLTFSHSYENSGNHEHLVTKVVSNIANHLKLQNVAPPKTCHPVVVEMKLVGWQEIRSTT